MINKVTIIGRLGNDPVIKQTQLGTPIANVSIATTEKWKDKATGDKREEVEWHKVVFFSPLRVCL